VHAGFGKAHLRHANANPAAQQPDQNLIQYKWGQEFNVVGLR